MKRQMKMNKSERIPKQVKKRKNKNNNKKQKKTRRSVQLLIFIDTIKFFYILIQSSFIIISIMNDYLIFLCN